MNLPNSFVTAIGKYGIGRDDVAFAAIADLDGEFRFADSIVAITDKKLIVARYPYREKREYRLGGYDSWAVQNAKDSVEKMAEPGMLIYDLVDVEKLEVLRQVSTGILMGKIKGTEQYLCQFSNTKMEAFMRLCRILEKSKKGEEITKEDLDVKRGKECCPKCGMIYPDQERKVCPKCMDKKSILWRIVKYFTPYKGKLVIMMFCYLATAGLNLIWPYLSGTVLYDKVLEKDERFLAAFHVPAGRFMLALGILVIVMVLTKVLAEIMAITVTGPEGAQTARMLSELEACTAGHDNTYCDYAHREEVAAAHETGLSCGKYKAFLRLQKLDPGITPEMVQGMTMREIQDMIERLSPSSGSGTDPARGNGHHYGEGEADYTQGNGHHYGEGGHR